MAKVLWVRFSVDALDSWRNLPFGRAGWRHPAYKLPVVVRNILGVLES